MKDILERYHLHSNSLGKMDQPSLELQLENGNHVRLSKEVADKTNQLRQMRGEDLQGLNLDDILKLEKVLEAGLSHVLESKEEKIMNEISTLEKKMIMLSKGKRSRLVDSDIMIQEEGMSLDQSVTNVYSCNSGPPPEDDSSDTSLRLGSLQSELLIASVKLINDFRDIEGIHCCFCILYFATLTPKQSETIAYPNPNQPFIQSKVSQKRWDRVTEFPNGEALSRRFCVTQKGSSLKGKQPAHSDTSTGKKRKAIDAIMEMELSKKIHSDKDTDSRKTVESPDPFSMSKAVKILILYFLLHGPVRTAVGPHGSENRERFSRFSRFLFFQQILPEIKDLAGMHFGLFSDLKPKDL
ncbi:hypothetical protein SO802_022442 [Lithocarpus litseifolius]|uniref:K-box domain-containing protein n=1 Tax=Lithocarpus litseifolius TaxID=425828 RepID=A0AAW2CHS4_9ROSI